VRVPPVFDEGHVYHLFPVLSAEREAIRERLRGQGIETLVHYPVAIPRQPALATEDPADCPIANRICDEVFSLPLYPQLSDDLVDDVAAALK
jgi:dTDP-4-amino-4,6-dideoxygalactose transaminase